MVEKEDIDPYVINNQYLMRGYRKNFDTVRLSFKSLFMVHNELMNIWTHLIGAVCFIGIMFFIIPFYSVHSANYSLIKRNFSLVDTLQGISDHYNENMDLMLDLVNNPAHYAYAQDLHQFNQNRQIMSYVDSVIHRYSQAIEDTVRKLEDEELHFLKEFSDNCEYIREKVKHIIKIIKIKYKSLAESKHISAEAIVGKVKRCFHYDTIHHLLTAMIYPYLEYFPIVVYLLCVVACLGFSATFHTFKCISQPIQTILRRLDMAGISILNFGSSYAVFYYAFYCKPVIRDTYSFVLLVACLTVFFVSLGDRIQKHCNAKYKGLMFAFLGISNLIPLTHLYVLSFEASAENDNMPFNIAFIGILLMGGLYLFGLLIYVAKFPEKFYPRRFDIWLNSHTIWHLFVLAAAVVHLFNVIYMYEQRKHIHCTNC